jgi:hypothetical protein
VGRGDEHTADRRRLALQAVDDRFREDAVARDRIVIRVFAGAAA